MSLLAPLYLAGLAAVSLPIVFHLIRRTPRGRTFFSSLMFLEPSPPRFERRRRIDQIALLCLRGLVLSLLALAFARPFLRSEARVQAETIGGRVALLVDTSASMRRPGLWDAALRAAEAALRSAPPGALVSLHTFDRELVTAVSREASIGLERGAGIDLVRSQLETLTPTWAATDLGSALVGLAERLQEQHQPADPAPTIVLISDLQQGSDLAALETQEWPEDVRLELRRLHASGSNASLHAVPPDPARSDEVDAVWVRLANDADSEREQFRLHWAAGETRDPSARQVYCPPGESRVVRAPDRPAAPGFDRLVLSGDDCPFDNVLFDRAPIVQPIEVLSLGSASGAEGDLDFFLGHVFEGRPARPVEVVSRSAESPPALHVSTTPLVVAKLDPAAPQSALGVSLGAALLDYVQEGGVVLAVLAEPAGVESTRAPAELRALLGEPGLELAEAEGTRHALLGEIDFDHPLFAPFADPRFSDFTKIRFWRHRRIEVPAWTELRVLASFDDGAPFLVERVHGAGRALVATSSWDPRDSDFARSSKFAPLLHGMLRLAGELDPARQTFHVGDRVPLARAGAASAVHVTAPDGTRTPLATGEAWFTDTWLPGHYEVEIGEAKIGARTLPFTVHLDPAESRTEPLEVDQLARRGVPAGPLAGAGSDTGSGAELAAGLAEAKRQLNIAELESRQKLWRWLIVAALAALLLETVWAGRLARSAGSSSA